MRPARAEAAGRLRRTLDVRGPEIDDIACQAAADAVVSIIRKVPEFRGEATFTTWAVYKVMYDARRKLRSALAMEGYLGTG
ncbi:hypothetical protein ACQPWY_00830 [Pseudonocardia xinjiangensis]|uniref:hypothetical protein n=1 Tax=Pseudonocardia xinjiangensis TaxID=75289 RepID=UPI003D8E7DB5